MIRLLPFVIALWFGALSSASAHDVLAALKTSGVIRMGYLEDAPPFSARGASGPPEGFSVELCARVAAAIGREIERPDLRVEWVPVTLADRFEAVAKGRVEIECSTSTWTFSRQKSVEFSLMIFVDGGTILIRNDSDFSRVRDFAGQRVAVVRNTTTQRSVADALQRREMTAEIVLFDDAEAALAALRSGAVDGYASDRVKLLGTALGAQGAGGFRLLDEDFSMEPYALAMHAGDPGFRIAVNRALAAIYRSGDISIVYERWLAPLGKPSLLLDALYYLQRIPE